jgi:hypothetical protein
MAYFGRSRDIDMFSNINNELLGQIIEQKVGYYQAILDESDPNIYGESLDKKYIGPVLLTCLLERGDTTPLTDDFGMDIERKLTVRVFKPHLITANVEPSVGDIILWNEDYYEVNNVNENQLVVGKDPDYAYTSADYVPDTGISLSIILECFYIRPEKVNIRENRFPGDPGSLVITGAQSGGSNTGNIAGNGSTPPAPGYNINGVQYTPVKVSTLSWEPYRRTPQYLKNQNPRIIGFYWEDIYWKFMDLTFYRQASANYIPDMLYNIVEINGVPTLNPYGPPSDGNYIINYDDFTLTPNRGQGYSTVDNPAIMTLVNSVPTFINLFNNGNGTMTSGDPIITTPTSGGTTNGGLYTKFTLATSVYYNQNSSLTGYIFSNLLPISNQSFKAQILSTLTVPNANNQFASWQAFNLYVDGPIQVGTNVRSDEYGINLFNLGGNINDCLYLNITDVPTEPQRTLYLDKLEVNGIGNTYWNPFYNPSFEIVRVISGSITEVTAFNDIT